MSMSSLHGPGLRRSRLAEQHRPYLLSWQQSGIRLVRGSSPVWRDREAISLALPTSFAPRLQQVALTGVFHRRLLPEVIDVTKDRRNRQHFAVAAVAHETIAPTNVTLDVEAIP